MATVTIAGSDFTTYASVAEADAYLLANIDFATWDANADDAKGRFLVSATRLLDSQNWLPAYDTFAERNAETNIVFAGNEIANYLSNGGTEILGLEEKEADVKRLKAGSAEIENFRDNSTASLGRYTTIWPPAVFALLKGFLAGAGSTSLGALSYATSTCSSEVDSGLIGA